MIKNSAYIRKFSTKQKQALEKIATNNKILTAKKVLLFTLEKFADQQAEIDRLNRLLDYKQKKIKKLEKQ